MFTLNHQYKNKVELIKWLEENNFASEDECLVQFFCGIPTKEMMQTVSSTLHRHLPKAHILGSTTDGEILSDDILYESIIVSVSVFKKTKIYSTFTTYSTNSYDMGCKIATKLNQNDAKVMILFTTGLAINGEHFLDGVRNTSDDECIISGGLAGDNGNFKQTFISYQDKVIQKGAVGVILCSTELTVKNNYEFGWEPVGLPMVVTKSKDNIIYELNNLPIIDVYTKYFGEEISNMLPKIGVEIPLIVNRNGQNIARATLNRYEDGSLLFAGNILEGEKVRFGLGSVEKILKNSDNICRDFYDGYIPESVFVYSCMARRRLLNTQANIELKMLSSYANISGFFTYGEFFSNKQNSYLFNETMTIIALSENNIKAEPKKIVKSNITKHLDKNILMYAVTHMTNVIAKEWQEKVDVEVAKNKMQEEQNFQQAKQAQMGEMIGMIAHQWRQPLNAISATAINVSLLSSMGMLKDDKVQKDSFFIQEQCQKMSETIDTFMNFVKPGKESRKFKISDTLNSIIYIMGAQLANHNIIVSIIETDEDSSIVGHEDLLEQVIINILANARDAFNNIGSVGSNQNEKFIKIGIEKQDNVPLVIIEDNAGGIPDDIQKKIFNPYFTTKEQGKGTGIGLYMSSNIMKKAFSGDLKYERTENGSKFILVCGELDS